MDESHELSGGGSITWEKLICQLLAFAGLGFATWVYTVGAEQESIGLLMIGVLLALLMFGLTCLIWYTDDDDDGGGGPEPDRPQPNCPFTGIRPHASSHNLQRTKPCAPQKDTLRRMVKPRV